MTESESGEDLGRTAATLPSKEEIMRLPLRAQVAFAGRCARRVQPLFVERWPDLMTLNEHHASAIDEVISLVQSAAVSPVSRSRVYELAYLAHNAGNSAARHHSAFVSADVARAAHSAAHAACSAADAADAYTGGPPRASDAAYAHSHCAAHACSAAHSSADAANTPAAIEAIRRDFELLCAAAEQDGWTHDTPVPQSFFGPFWPQGEPEDWPEEAMEPRLDAKQYELIVEGPAGASENEVLEATRQLARHLDRLNRSPGGRGIHIRNESNVHNHRFEPEVVPTG
jgi:hypothetical protein